MCIGFSIFCTFTISSKLEELLADPNTFADFDFLGYWQTQFNSAVAVCVFFAWFKLFKYISFNKTMTQLSSTLSRVCFHTRIWFILCIKISWNIFITYCNIIYLDMYIQNYVDILFSFLKYNIKPMSFTFDNNIFSNSVPKMWLASQSCSSSSSLPLLNWGTCSLVHRCVTVYH